MAHLKTRRLTLKILQNMGLPIVPGRFYVRKEWLPSHRRSLETLHRKMAMFRGSLAEEMARARDEG